MQSLEVVASLRISQAWGSAQMSGALHQIRSISPISAIAPHAGAIIGTGPVIGIPDDGLTLISPIAVGVLDEDFG